jgi:hypothetical protein
MPKIAWLVLACCIGFYGSPAPASTFNDCKNVALAHYLAAAKLLSQFNMGNAVGESTACNRFWGGAPPAGRISSCWEIERFTAAAICLLRSLRLCIE